MEADRWIRDRSLREFATLVGVYLVTAAAYGANLEWRLVPLDQFGRSFVGESGLFVVILVPASVVTVVAQALYRGKHRAPTAVKPATTGLWVELPTHGTFLVPWGDLTAAYPHRNRLEYHLRDGQATGSFLQLSDEEFRAVVGHPNFPDSLMRAPGL